MKILSALLTALALLGLSSCTSLPDNVRPVSNFKLDRYLGKWYEIARLDHSFERGLSNVSAEYSLREDGAVRVLNRGYDAGTQKWKEAEGVARFVDAADTGHLKVSFFGPFYGAYGIFELDHAGYQYALISGPDKSYLWLLARSPQLDPGVRDALLAKAAALGFDTGKLILVKHD
ncbi:lipocalin family protein [Uliginosibacterium sp. 31-12]|uniref:lipocalin family protein n=1 Tax=Uliginosibacterium sp. 31-12 TaxID=3062781 RepID=UPI0026E22861|nr:lipocalin family protein [Uliginosibacterium sp. 31-12]MDO6386235.1 lipocalin family protein [Uliginosibacterium sp. 31-12]